MVCYGNFPSNHLITMSLHRHFAHPLLGGMSAEQFLRDYWQRRPLLIRGALKEQPAPLSRASLFSLAGQDEVECRILIGNKKEWSVEHGPFSAHYLRKINAPHWALLVQSVNLYEDTADTLLRSFDFIPQLRLDDLMISWSSSGGGVGPHIDSYDVFLIQSIGRKRWRIHTHPPDTRCIEGLPLSILRRFSAEEDWVLEPGDMLYLPPGVAHYGLALEPGMTCSVGFRAPNATDLGRRFLEYQSERMEYTGVYQDKGISPPQNTALIDDGSLRRLWHIISPKKRFSEDFVPFLGEYLTEPKSHVVFEPPTPPLSLNTFTRKLFSSQIHLNRKTILLYRPPLLYINGESAPLPSGDWLPQLAHQRYLNGKGIPSTSIPLLYSWYNANWVHLENT